MKQQAYLIFTGHDEPLMGFNNSKRTDEACCNINAVRNENTQRDTTLICWAELEEHDRLQQTWALWIPQMKA